MSIWYLIILVLGIFTVVFWIIEVKRNPWKDWAFLVALTAGILFVVMGITIPFMQIQYEQNTKVFREQAAYLEAHISKNEIEDAAITSKKIELNDWLYNAKFAKDKFGIFSLIPDEVNYLEPIE